MACEQPLNHVTIIGVGLLGGSIGLALRDSFPDCTTAGVGRRQASLDVALRVGAIDTATTDAAEVVGDSDLVVLCTPVGAFARHLAAIAPHLKDHCAITDVGSTKREVVAIAEATVGHERFVGCHPMAGMEKKGPRNATADLYRDALCVLTPVEQTPRPLVERIDAFWKLLGMRTVEMTPAAHDRAVATVSHVPHLLSSLLMSLPATADLPVAATGLRDMTRLAAGDPEMWRDIALSNRKPIVETLTRLGEDMAVLADAITRGDADGIVDLLEKAKTRREETFSDGA
ncbi:MAG: prephenate dehydrogenase/arogenate dehydrogenase family protein [Planctomycetes bacterium]|jgi:prephenate dehydrogenase|nr:prephenate dehydrogenase [Phycisphaerae bacterium]NBB94883.1 prephenate dehydrogenase/arogenate dehydrogenase family protein [Planctomycetota bacterium]